MLTIEDAIKDLIEAIGAEITTAIRAIATDPKLHAMLVDAAIAEMKAQHEHHQARRKSSATDVAAFDSEATAKLAKKDDRKHPEHGELHPPVIPLPARPRAPEGDGTLATALRQVIAPIPVTRPATPVDPPMATSAPATLQSEPTDQWSQARDDLLRDLYSNRGGEIPVIVGRLNQLPGAKVHSGAVNLRILYLQLKRGDHGSDKPPSGLSVVADIHQIRHWAAPRGIVVDTADDVPKVNAARQNYGLPPFALQSNARSSISP